MTSALRTDELSEYPASVGGFRSTDRENFASYGTWIWCTDSGLPGSAISCGRRFCAASIPVVGQESSALWRDMTRRARRVAKANHVRRGECRRGGGEYEQ